MLARPCGGRSAGLFYVSLKISHKITDFLKSCNEGCYQPSVADTIEQNNRAFHGRIPESS
jgi:hypothetical protein